MKRRIINLINSYFLINNYQNMIVTNLIIGKSLCTDPFICISGFSHIPLDPTLKTLTTCNKSRLIPQLPTKVSFQIIDLMFHR